MGAPHPKSIALSAQTKRIRCSLPRIIAIPIVDDFAERVFETIAIRLQSYTLAPPYAEAQISARLAAVDALPRRASDSAMSAATRSSLST